MDLLDEPYEQKSDETACGDPEQNGDGHLPYDVPGKSSARRHRGERSEQNDDKYVVRGSARHDHVRDPLIRSVSGLFQSQHAGNDDRRRDRRYDAAEDCRVRHGEFEEQETEQSVGEDLGACGEKTKQNGGTSVFF